MNMIPSSDKADKADRAAFFDQLYSLGQISDEEDALQELEDDNKRCHPDAFSTPTEDSIDGNHLSKTSSDGDKCTERHGHSPHPTPPCTTIVEANPLSSRKFLATMSDNTANLTSETSVSENNGLDHPHSRILPRRTVSALTSSDSTLSPEMASSSLGKRKRKEQKIKYLPEREQIFKGLNFFYIPNNDKCPLRRARIIKARERGAKWSSIWDLREGITHIIVDQNITYRDVASFLKFATIPLHITLVADTYPVDCIQFRAVLNPDQNQYKVSGCPRELEKPTLEAGASPTPEKSLQLKLAKAKPGKWDFVPPRITPPRSENSTQMGTQASLESEAIDALELIIKEAQTLSHLPLDDEDQSPSDKYTEAEDTSDDDCSVALPISALLPSEGPKKASFNQESFICMSGGTGKTSSRNPNTRTIAVLQEMADYYAKINDPWRPISYRKAINILHQQKEKIISAEEAFKLPFVGRRLALKIEEIANTDRLRRLENARDEPGDHTLQKFMGIYGVGFSQANKWFHVGYTTFDDLKNHAQLTENQLLGIDHYEDFQTRIPRDEVTALGEIVRATAATIDPKIEIIIGGSYRRGAATSGDIDCIVTKANTTSKNNIFDLLRDLITELTARRFLVAALAIPQTESGSKWHGCCVLPESDKPIWRRIDFLLVPASELGAALLYFTGNDIFNRSIRLLASRKGMRLNQRGLYKDVMRGSGRLRLNEGELVEGADEKRIFAALGVPWRTPEERIC